RQTAQTMPLFSMRKKDRFLRLIPHARHRESSTILNTMMSCDASPVRSPAALASPGAPFIPIAPATSFPARNRPAASITGDRSHSGLVHRHRAAINEQVLADHERRVVAGEKEDRLGGLVRPAGAFEHVRHRAGRIELVAADR